MINRKYGLSIGTRVDDLSLDDLELDGGRPPFLKFLSSITPVVYNIYRDMMFGSRVVFPRFRLNYRYRFFFRYGPSHTHC